jgi:glucokinase
MADRDNSAGLQFPVLIGDIGGTNARFAVLADPSSGLGETRIVQTASFASIDEAVQQTVLAELKIKPRSAVFAVAGPVDGDEIALTN